MSVRHICAILGVAIAVGTVTFMQGLVATNDHQATAVAERLLKEVPVATNAAVAQFAIDYRPNGRVMQGPPLVACLATVPCASCLVLCAGREAQSTKHKAQGTKPGECVVTKAMFAQRRLPVPPVGTELTLIGRRKTHYLKIAAIIDWEKPLRGYPNCFVSAETAAAIDEEWRDWEPKTVEELAPGFTSDAGRNMDRAKPLLLWAAALTALCLLVNTLFLTIEAKRKEIAILRMVGMTRGGVVFRVFLRALHLTVLGDVLGLVVASAALWVYVKLDPVTFPTGPGPLNPLAWDLEDRLFVASIAVALLAALIALRPALKVKPLEAASNRMPRKKHLGMLIAFACGFGAFVAVEVWGSSLMSAFVPSPEWPDAIVSILPVGVSSFDIEKVQSGVKGVRKIHELAPLQVNLEPLEELKGPQGRANGDLATKGRKEGARAEGRGGLGGRGKQYRNALLLGSDWLPEFRFVAGERESAEKAIREGDNCIITAMMARARKLKLGDELKLDCGRGLRIALKIVGIVDLNWHMVTSRGLVRGLNRMPVNTDGPVFVSFDTVEACDMRPAPMVKMTHLWLDYEPEFLKAHGAFEAGRIVEREIVEALGMMTEEIEENAVRLHSRDEVADGTLAHGVEIIGSMAKVPFIFILVISLGFVAMLVASFDSRKREFRVLRAVGATKGQLARVLVGETLKVAGGGVVIGLFGGALVGWLCTAGTRAAMANWGIPPSFAVPYLTIAKGALGAVVFALLVAVPTAMAIIRKAGLRGNDKIMGGSVGMNHKAIALAVELLFALGAGAAEKVARVEVDLGKRTGAVRPELHSSSWRSKVTDYDGGGPQAMRKLNMKAWRSHDAALVESGQRVIDTHFIFPLLHLDAKNPSNYCFKATDNLIRRVREKDGLEVFYRMGSSIEHTSNADAVNTLDPGDHDKYAEVLAGIVRHYNRGWADGYRWNIRYWELFNEPDVNACWRGTHAGFVDLFVKCVKRLKDEFGDEIKVGGPAFASVKEDYVRELLGACRKAGAKPDFFSWHHYGSDPDVIVAQPAAVKKLVADCGFGDMELILNEWHYLTDNKWDHLWTKADPEVFYHAYVGPASQGGIDSAAFTLTVESRFQDTCLGQSYFYGCGREWDNWGYYDRYERKFNKVYYAMQIMGEVVKGGREKVACTSSEKAVTPFAAVSADGRRAYVAVADYKSGKEQLEIRFANLDGYRLSHVRILDWDRDLERMDVRLADNGVLRLPKATSRSACFLVELEK